MSDAIIWNPYWKRLLMLNQTESVAHIESIPRVSNSALLSNIDAQIYAARNEVARIERIRRALLKRGAKRTAA